MSLAMQMTDKPKSFDPLWANGLRQLYDAVLDEPLPDAFRELLAKLDETGEK